MGTDESSGKFCASCRSALADPGVKFCPECGVPTSPVSASSVPPPPPAGVQAPLPPPPVMVVPAASNTGKIVAIVVGVLVAVLVLPIVAIIAVRVLGQEADQTFTSTGSAINMVATFAEGHGRQIVVAVWPW